ncbi:MAG: hypothetical protein GDA48_02625 [Hormoscilla sp. GM102CHS1]|nr:hypothetical protein [Hormoscilla sp. GM102CHS1]
MDPLIGGSRLQIIIARFYLATRETREPGIEYDLGEFQGRSDPFQFPINLSSGASSVIFLTMQVLPMRRSALSTRLCRSKIRYKFSISRSRPIASEEGIFPPGFTLMLISQLCYH